MRALMSEPKTTLLLAGLWGFVSGLLAFIKTGAITQAIVYFLGALIVGGLFCLLLGWIWSLVSKKAHHMYLVTSWLLIISIGIRLIRLVVELGAPI